MGKKIFNNCSGNDPLLEFEPISHESLSISKNPCVEIGYVLHALRNTWVFPWWYKTVLVNVKNITITDGTIGLIRGFSEKEYKVKLKIIDNSSDIKIKVKSISVPRKIETEQIIASLDILKCQECYLVPNTEERDKQEG